MKVSIGYKIQEGPYGGGNTFIVNLSKYLLEEGHTVVYDLKDKDIDIILLINPLKESLNSSFNHYDIYFYLKFINNNALVCQRINECDERKGTIHVNRRILEANKVADCTVFVSNWLKDLFLSKHLFSNFHVIMSGSDNKIFKYNLENNYQSNQKFRLTTHHWSSNWMKGFEIYLLIDKLLEKNYWKEKLEFSYIGNVTDDIYFKNTKILNPMVGIDLANELKKNHGYVTGSINEPSGNHHIEAAQLGLPILYLNSGGIPEYCNDFGVSFESENFEEKLEEFIRDYTKYRKNLLNYPFNSHKMSSEYLNLFQSLLDNKNKFILNRKKVSFIKAIVFKLINLIYVSKEKTRIKIIKAIKKVISTA